ncbi:dual specificity protein kinase TTK [Sitodiplosis mosellana]|uniref:dual specificity protein kinase TTK n=1 Tax=Sitodiplosis mosellana TaxID=263140 RepID=UPI00244476E1|nr:dual specificity protein kinase TTK [Sitodiplosis mosellana]
MSFPNSKRISDIDYQTPLRTSVSESFTKKDLLPKRISELSPLESSDDEDQGPNNAFLNDSFIESPMDKLKNNSENNQNAINKKTDLIFSASNLPSIKEKGETSAENTGKRDSTSRQLNFDDPDGDVVNKKEPDRPKISLFSKLQSNDTTRKLSESVTARVSDASWKTKTVEVKSADSLNAPLEALAVKQTSVAPTKTIDSLVHEPKLCTEQQTPKVKSADRDKSRNAAPKPNPDDEETPYKGFQMPPTLTMRRVQSTSQHRTILSSASQTKKCRSELENEFKSQKVLFRTPSAVSRPAMKVMNHLGLDDSLNCYQSSPMANLSPVKEERNKDLNHSTNELIANDLYRSTDKLDGAKDVATKEVLKSSATLSDSADTKKTITINGKDFVIQSKIGQGGSSSVFLVEHKDTKLPCALKVVDLRGDPALIEGYIKEVKILAMLQDKLNVIRLYEYALISSENLLYMVMEKGDSDLRKILQTYNSSLPLYTLMSYWHQMLESVGYIHKKDIIHSDLKPENFLMVRGRLKLIDFGISSKMAVDATSIIKHSQVGTFNYISPEALMDTSTGNSPISKKHQPKIKISPKSDVWSLGCILYLLLYKKTPFAHIKNIYAKMQAIINPSKEIEYSKLPNYYPSMLLEMVQLCLKHNPKERASVADLLKFPIAMVIPINNTEK